VEVPLSQECKRVLNFAAEEAERLGHKHVWHRTSSAGHPARRKCFGAEILTERGLRLSALRRNWRAAPGKSTGQPAQGNSLLAEFSRDLTQAALEGQLDPLVGRDKEVERVIQILCRRTKK